MRLTASVLLLGLLPCALLPCAHLAAQRSNAHPLLQGLVPRGGQRGTEVTLNLYGRRLGNVQGIYQLEDGIQLLEARSLRNNRAQLRIKIRDDCRLGTHRLALRTGLGVSNLKTFHVGVLPEVSEVEPNNTLQQAQKIRLDVTVNGLVRAEDNDYFAIDVNAGQQVNFEVQGLRLADLEFDPYLRLLDANGNVLTQLDDSILGFFDPCGSYTFKKAGTYVVHVRETAFGGSNNSHYRLHIGSFPRPSVAFPPGGRPGELLKATAIGPAGRQPLEVRLPAQPDPRYRHHVVTETGTSPTPILLCVSDLPAQLEPSLGGVATAKPAPKPATLGPWHFLGPFAWRQDKPRVYPPEEQPNPPKLPLKTDFVGRDGVIRWRRLGGVRDDRVFDLRKAVPKPNGCVVFLHREIRSPSKRRALFLLAGDDELKVWLNGKRVHQSKSRRAAPNAHRLFLGLRQGRNQLLLKLTNAGGGLGFQGRVLEPHRNRGLGFLVAPLAVHGILSKAGESDRFRFHAKKGQRLDICVIARQLRSPLDAVLHVTSSTDRFYVGSDDVGRNMDSLVRFGAPHTGEFNLTLVDRLGRGGPEYVYRLEIYKPKPRPASARIAVPGQPDTWTASVPQGGRMATLVSVRDMRASGTLELQGLPAGVSATIPPLRRGNSVVPVLLTATADAPLAGALCAVQAHAGGKLVDPGFRQLVTLVRARNNTPFLSTVVKRLPVAVTRKSPFVVELTAPKVALVRGSPMRLNVQVKRAAGFKQPVRVRLLYNPSGVTANQATIPQGKDRGYLSLNARTNARIGTVPIVVVGRAKVGGGPFESSSALVDLQVAAPMIQAKIGSVRGSQGQKVQLAIEFTKKQGFAGSCRAQLVNLPRGISASSPEIRADTKRVMVDVTLDRRAPPGRHRNLRLRLRVPTKDGVMLHEYRGGEIRVDRARPGKGL